MHLVSLLTDDTSPTLHECLATILLLPSQALFALPPYTALVTVLCAVVLAHRFFSHPQALVQLLDGGAAPSLIANRQSDTIAVVTAASSPHPLFPCFVRWTKDR